MDRPGTLALTRRLSASRASGPRTATPIGGSRRCGTARRRRDAAAGVRALASGGRGRGAVPRSVDQRRMGGALPLRAHPRRPPSPGGPPQPVAAAGDRARPRRPVELRRVRRLRARPRARDRSASGLLAARERARRRRLPRRALARGRLRRARARSTSRCSGSASRPSPTGRCRRPRATRGRTCSSRPSWSPTPARRPPTRCATPATTATTTGSSPRGRHRLPPVDVLARNNVRVSGQPDGPAMVFAHGFGCDQNMWRFVAPALRGPTTGSCCSTTSAPAAPTSPPTTRNATARCTGYADDVLEILRRARPARRGLRRPLGQRDDRGPRGRERAGPIRQARARRALTALHRRRGLPRRLRASRTSRSCWTSLESNYLGWSSAMAPVIMGNPDRPELGEELTASFCRTDPEIARRFARVTFLSDNRADLRRGHRAHARAAVQRRRDRPGRRGRVRARADRRPVLVRMEATGHCPNLSAPQETIDAIRAFV